MATIKGYGCTVDWDDDSVTIDGTNKVTRVALFGEDRNEGPVRLQREEILSADFKKANVIKNGSVVLKTEDKRYVLHFLSKGNAEFERLSQHFTPEEDEASGR